MCLLYCYPFFIFFLFFRVPFLHSSANNCVEEGSVVIDGTSNSTLVSPNGVFELGFFTPDENTNKNTRYLGIWYFKQSNPKIIVWVASRDKPLLGPNGSLVIEHRKAKVLDGRGLLYWSTDGGVPVNSDPTFNENSPNEVLHLSKVHKPSLPPLPPHVGKPPFNNSTRNSTRLCLRDDGNLVLDNIRELGNPVLWQSFKQPTDTLLPGMTADKSSIDLSSTTLNLTSWQNPNNPAPGNFKFPLRPNIEKVLFILQRGLTYWQSGTRTIPSDMIPSNLSELWFNDGNHHPLSDKTRLVMNITGQIQFWKLDTELGWSLVWSEPKDGCSVYEKCGSFGSCNSNSGQLCKCLPGFKPTPKWNSGDTSGGCTPISGSLCERTNSSGDTFFPLHWMKVGNRSCTVPSSTERNCSSLCLTGCNCVAYSNGFVDCSGASTKEKTCLHWSDLTDLQEERSSDGITINVRTIQSDIDPTSRGCSPCGAYIIPYPLSTRINCGDPSYFHFHCINETGQVKFSTPKGNFRVTSIASIAHKFTIQVMHNICDTNYIDNSVLSLKYSMPFTYQNCTVVKDQPLIQVKQPYILINISWLLPPEFVCHAASDCNQWPHTSCKNTYGVFKRCLCGSKFHWNGMKLECTRVHFGHFPVKVVVYCIAGALAIVLMGIIIFVYHIRKRRMVKGRGSLEFEGDDTTGIDVPFFDWESILAATNNYADANRLGTGGFGSVYMGNLPDGQKIAVKRLASVSVQGVEEFRIEVMLIAKLQHRNLVRLIGYCMKADEKILIYEYMPSGSLDSCLFDEKHFVYLDWKQRFDIILGIARGLVYLHQDSRLRIIHRDLKPSNILLDEELNPKISDFGIARIVGGKETQASTNRVVGTYGYMSPEYASDGIFSVKSDVFSFGVVILVTVSGRRNSKIFMFEHGLSLLGHAWKLCNEDKGLELMDPKLNESCFPSEVLKCIHIGLLCVQEDPSDRPTMSTVVHMLSVENTSLPVAKQPAFMNRKPLSENASSSSAMDSSVHEVMTVSTVGR